VIWRIVGVLLLALGALPWDALAQSLPACSGGMKSYTINCNTTACNIHSPGTGLISSSFAYSYDTVWQACDAHRANMAAAFPTEVVTLLSWGQSSCLVKRENASTGAVIGIQQQVPHFLCGSRTLVDFGPGIQAVQAAASGVYTSTGATPTGGSSGGSIGTTSGTVTLDATGAIAAWQAASAFDSTKAGDLLSLFGLFLAAAVAVLCLKWVYNFFKVDQ